MFEKFLSENIENFRQRYEGTFGFYRADGNKRLLVKLTAVSVSTCNFTDASGTTYNVDPDHPDDVGFEFLPPKSQWYNTPEGAVFTQRVASRQFQRGVTSKTLEIHLLRDQALYPMSVNFKNLQPIYESPTTPRDALKKFGPKCSLAISGQFALDRGLVFLLKEPIGGYERDGSAFKFNLVERDLWKTEISDAIVAMGCSASFS
jgi:hypothetical protein